MGSIDRELGNEVNFQSTELNREKDKRFSLLTIFQRRQEFCINCEILDSYKLMIMQNITCGQEVEDRIFDNVKVKNITERLLK